ncbi:diheme cytochrome c [Magnetospirillum sp. 15-1]|uniref:diheme cytochrome c n=1 Tax=Magnetospirillum sp. 15-1 TaxID=1979370 RepID=UPI001F5B1C18|nr:diheme cytochrome c [Magnetospirillum sp. 15-1]
MMKRIILAAVFSLSALPALADHVRPVTDPETLKACGECHMAFQPAFLPARSWTRMMGQLSDHFGDNAGMASDKAERIRQVLVAGAADTGGGKAGRKALRGIALSETPLRITETPRFIAKHERISEREWKRPEVMTRSNCVACHRGAETGSYEDE